MLSRSLTYMSYYEEIENDHREVHQEHGQVDIPKNKNLFMSRSADYECTYNLCTYPSRLEGPLAATIPHKKLRLSQNAMSRVNQLRTVLQI